MQKDKLLGLRDLEINWIYIDEYNSFEEIYSYAKAVIERGLLYG